MAPRKLYKVTLLYDSVVIGSGVVSNAQLHSTFHLTDLNFDARIVCGSPFCQRGQRPLSVPATLWRVVITEWPDPDE